MNKSQQGKKFENYCADELKKDGWFIAFKSRRTRFGKNDFCSLFDIVAYRRWITHIEIIKERLYISCKDLTNGHGWLKRHKLAIEDFKSTYGLEGERFEIWVKKKGEVEKIVI